MAASAGAGPGGNMLVTRRIRDSGSETFHSPAAESPSLAPGHDRAFPIPPVSALNSLSPGRGPSAAPAQWPHPEPPQRARSRRGRPFRSWRDMALFLALRFFWGVAIMNVVLSVVLLAWRGVLRWHCTPLVPQPGEEQHASPPGSLRHDAAYLRQLHQVTLRAFFRRRVPWRAAYFSPTNDALLPTVSCPQKMRVGTLAPGNYLWLCAPQHLFKLHWPMAYSRLERHDFPVESDLFHRWSITSTLFDPDLPEGKAQAPHHSFVSTVGGPEAEAYLAKLLAEASRPADGKASGGMKFVGGVPLLYVGCHACDHSFLLPAISQKRHAFPGASPAAGQIVVRLERWIPPFDESSRAVLGALEQAGYHMFHSEQLFGSYGNQSYLVSFIHQSLLFPKLLGLNYTWQTETPKRHQHLLHA